ncbi:MAG: GNAT family N-acetyltransferase [Pseudomonadota bacterium]
MTIRLETDRLILTPLAPSDVEDHIAMLGDPRVARVLMPNGVPESFQDRWRRVASYIGHWNIRGFGFFALRLKSTGAWVGAVGPHRPGDWPGIECGWTIASAHWGAGYAPEGAQAAIRWIFEERSDLSRIISLIDPTNEPSQAVARKVGETKTRDVYNFAGHKLEIWAADREDWLARFSGS